VNYRLFNLLDGSTVLPDFNINCKFILIENLTDCWLVFGELKTYRYHAQLVHGFCTFKQVECGWVSKQDYAEIYDADYIVKGGGIIILNRDNLLIEFRGYSKAYGRFDPLEVEQFVLKCPGCNGLRVLTGT